MAASKRLLEHFRDRTTAPAKPPMPKAVSLLLGAVIAVSTGIVLVKAGDSPMIRETVAD